MTQLASGVTGALLRETHLYLGLVTEQFLHMPHLFHNL